METEIEKSAEAFDGDINVLISLWKDGHVSICSDSKKGEQSCFTTKTPQGDEFYYLAQSYFSRLGFKIKTLHDSECGSVCDDDSPIPPVKK